MSTKIKEQEDVSVCDKQENVSTLILWNDDVNSFDWVIKCLMEIFSYDHIQSEQIALIVHNKGKCEIKSGEKDEMLKYKQQLNDRGLEATVEN